MLEFTSRPAKNGGKFGILKIQDYTGSAEFMLFGQDYIDFHNFGVPSTPIYLKGAFKRRFQNSDLRFKINSIKLLDQIKGTLVSGITLNVTADKLNEALRGVLAEHIKSSSDQTGSLSLRVIDPQTNRWITLNSQLRVPVNKDLVEKLENLEVDFTIDKT